MDGRRRYRNKNYSQRQSWKNGARHGQGVTNSEDQTRNENRSNNHPNVPCPFSKWNVYLPFATYVPDSSAEKAINALKHYFERNVHIVDMERIEKSHALNIDYMDMVSDAELKQDLPNLSADIQSSPDLYLSMISLAFHQVLIDFNFSDDLQSLPMIQDIPYINARLLNYEPVTYLRNIKASCFGKFVSVSGTVVRVSNVKPLATKMAFNCVSCGDEQVLTLTDGKYSFPSKCLTPECRSRSFIPNRSSSHTATIDSQIIKIQEIMLDDNREAGRIPRTVECELFSDLVDVCVPGDLITVNGIVKLSNNEENSLKNNKDKCMFLLYIYANSLTNFRNAKDKEDTENQSAEFSLKELYAIREIHAEKNLFKLIVGSLCPSIYGHELVKAGLILGLFGGTQRPSDDKSQIPIRSDVHILAVGDPGLGKSQMLQAVASAAPRGVFVCGNTTTTSGLTVTLSKESGTGDYALEAGALVLGDQGCCCIDEFDKMGTQHQALLEAMEQQSISIAKAGIVCSLPARTSIIAAANPVAGHYNKAKTLAENLKLSSALLSRFDLVFILLDKPDDELDSILSEHVLAIHSGNKNLSGVKQQSSSVQEDGIQDSDAMAKEQWDSEKALSDRLKVHRNEKFDPLPVTLLRKYISYARKYVKPKLTADAANVLQNFYLGLRRQYRGPDSTPVTTRQLESLIRLTEARAKLELRENATQQDAEDVIEIMKFSLVDIYVDDMGALNLERSLQGSGMSKRKQIKKFITELTRVADRDSNSLFSYDQMRQIALGMKLQTGNFQEFVESLNIQNFIIKKGSRCYQLQTAGF